MPIYKCRNCGNEYKQEASPTTCEVKPSCLGAGFFVDFSSYTQLVRANTELKIKESQLENKINEINTDEINKYNQALKKYLKISISVFIFFCLGTIGGGYWAYQKIQELKQDNQLLSSKLRSTRQNLESQVKQLQTDKSSLEYQKNKLQSDKSALENKIKTLQANYYNIFSSNHSLYILHKESPLSWNGSVSLTNSSNKHSIFIIEEDSYIDISLYDLSEGGDADFELFDSEGNSIPNSRKTVKGSDELSDFYVKAGSYYVKVWLYGDQTTSYTLKVSRH